MSKICIIVSLIIGYSLSLSIVSAGTDFKAIGEKKAGKWCVVQASAPADQLQQFLDYACGIIDCDLIQRGASCFEPDTVQSHASFALNEFYVTVQVCNFKLGHLTDVDPSYRRCIYS